MYIYKTIFLRDISRLANAQIAKKERNERRGKKLGRDFSLGSALSPGKKVGGH